MKHAVIFCTQPVHGTLYFYVLSGREEHYLFGQSFRPSLWKRYRFGVLLDDALDRAKCKPADRKICDKLFKALPYIEREYGVSLLRRNRKTSRRDRREDDEITDSAA